MSPSIRVTVTVPKEILNIQAVAQEIEAAVHDAGREIHAMFSESTSTWREKPVFIEKQLRSSGMIGVEVATSNDVYSWVNYGTRPHIIRPRNRGMLRFQTGYSSKSRVGSRRAYAGGKFGPFTSSVGVTHPGTEARHFDELIAADFQPVFEKQVQDAIIRGSK